MGGELEENGHLCMYGWVPSLFTWNYHNIVCLLAIPRSPTLQVDSLPTEPPGKPRNTGVGSLPLLQGIIPTPGIKLGSLTLQADSLPAELPVQFSPVAQSCPTLWDPMNRSTPGLPVHHQLPEFTQTHVHWVSDAIQPSHPLSSPSPPAPNPSQHQSLFQWVNSSHEVAKVLEFQLQHRSL